MSERLNREAGESPAWSRHCKRRVLPQKPLVLRGWEGRGKTLTRKPGDLPRCEIGPLRVKGQGEWQKPREFPVVFCFGEQTPASANSSSLNSGRLEFFAGAARYSPFPGAGRAACHSERSEQCVILSAAKNLDLSFRSVMINWV